MYSRQEISRQKQAFWTTFGQYMQPVSAAEGVKVNWVNYKTGIPGIQFKMDADNKQASIAIVLSHPDVAIQKLRYEKLLQLKTMLHTALQEEWNWQPNILDEHDKPICHIGTAIKDVNILRNEDWPMLISFFKPRIIALDEFWGMAKYGFEL